MTPRKQRRIPGTPGNPPLSPQDLARAATVKRYRETRGISQTELASILGVSQAAVSAYEAGRTRVPDAAFEQLAAQAAEDLDLARDSVDANQRSGDALGLDGSFPPDMPPEILATLKEAADAVQGSSSPEEAAARLGAITAGVAEKARAELPADKRAAARDVQMAYGLLAKIIGRFFDPVLASLVDEQSGELSVSVVQAAEVSPFFDRIVRLLRVGPVSTCVVLHVLLVAQYDERRRAVNAERRRVAQIEAPLPAPIPQPASVIEQLDPSVGGSPFAAAHAAA